MNSYRSFARTGRPLAVLRDQVQADHALRHGVHPQDLLEFDEYEDALSAVVDGRVGGYASVALAHRERLRLDSCESSLTVVTIPTDEVLPALGSFACASDAIRDALDVALNDLLGDGPPADPSPDSTSWVR
ncbi:hypothetical protein [Aeromicrobium sp. CnD17-E]|uniref:hypothetical protein n=1 Tax=Aeromicrobium sp. CnD17-E TaxID=2954487 RepID=UPI0020979BFB|nr:hypothetical protein [Aeromicrobium sp. CnD17-E]MCO7238797.1 hypothetical protein [Aeromicrobium sp. CnD17-E]